MNCQVIKRFLSLAWMFPKCYTGNMQIWFIGRTLASQAGKAGSTPVICFFYAHFSLRWFLCPLSAASPITESTTPAGQYIISVSAQIQINTSLLKNFIIFFLHSGNHYSGPFVLSIVFMALSYQNWCPINFSVLFYTWAKNESKNCRIFIWLFLKCECCW